MSGNRPFKMMMKEKAEWIRKHKEGKNIDISILIWLFEKMMRLSMCARSRTLDRSSISLVDHSLTYYKLYS